MSHYYILLYSVSIEKKIWEDMKVCTKEKRADIVDQKKVLPKMLKLLLLVPNRSASLMIRSVLEIFQMGRIRNASIARKRQGDGLCLEEVSIHVTSNET